MGLSSPYVSDNLLTHYSFHEYFNSLIDILRQYIVYFVVETEDQTHIIIFF